MDLVDLALAADRTIRDLTTDAVIEAIRAALRSNDRVGELDRLRRPETPAGVRVGVLPELVQFCAYNVQGHLYAAEAVALIDRAVLKERLWPLMESYLDGTDSQPFRNFALLLAELGLGDDLARLVGRARLFDDYDIREVADDFGPWRSRQARSSE